MTPLERAARVLCSDDGCNPDYDQGFLGSDGDWVEPGTPRWRDYLPTARAVLQAIREPSEAMVQAWFDAPLELPDGVSWQDPSSVTDPYQARSDWRAMIDAALEEG